MAQITVNYKMFIGAGQHRQPRNGPSDIKLSPTSTAQTPLNSSFFPFLEYTLANGGGTGTAAFVFWNETGGGTSITHPAGSVSIKSPGTDEMLTAWYRPISGPAIGSGGPVVFDDAFSSMLDRFISDTFVEVTGDAAATKTANVDGIVATDKAQTLIAKMPLIGFPIGSPPSTDEPFSQWVRNDVLIPQGTATLGLAKGMVGTAIAIYQTPRSPSSTIGQAILPNFAEIVRIIFGVIQDGGGRTDHGPVGPWTPLIQRLRDAATLSAKARTFDCKIAAKMNALIAQDSLLAIRAALPELEKLAAGETH